MTSLGPSLLASLPRIIGAERLGPYLDARDGIVEEAIRLYAWNIEASAALLGAYAALEVGVRNAMHDQLSALFARSDWWLHAPLTSKDRQHVAQAQVFLDKRKGTGRWGPGHVVAELNSSFWEGLLVNKYHLSLWEGGLSNAFPHYTGRRADLREKMERLRLLRNRAAHHEPIFARDLQIDHRYMCELAAFIDGDLHDWIVTHARLPDVIANRANTVAGKRRSRF